MKHSRADVRGKARLGLDIRFESQSLTSYSGLIVFQRLFSLIGIKERLWRCFRHLKGNPIYGYHTIMMMLVVHLIIGHRRLRDVEYYRDDEMVKRVLGLKRLPDVSTVSRSLASADEQSVAKVRSESRHLVMERLVDEGFSRVTLDFGRVGVEHRASCRRDGSGLQQEKEGRAQLLPPLLHRRPDRPGPRCSPSSRECPRLQRGRHLHRPLSQPRALVPSHTMVETRIDSAFFNETIAEQLHSSGVEFTISVPFERFAALKGLVEGRKRWRPMATGLSYFETRWKPKSWNARYRFIFIRKQVRCQHKLPIQLDLFQPTEYGYEFKVIVTNKRISPRRVAAFHEGRGSQESIFAELKTHCQMDYVPVKTRVGNQLYMFAGIVAHNLTRELQIQLNPRARGTTAKRAALWCFREIGTLRRTQGNRI